MTVIEVAERKDRYRAASFYFFTAMVIAHGVGKKSLARRLEI